MMEPETMIPLHPVRTTNDDTSDNNNNNDSNDTTDTNIDITDNNTIEGRYETEREKAKVRHWKESVYAVGLVEPTWADEQFNPDRDPLCNCVSIGSKVCARLGARRVGNMAVLRESVETMADDDDDSNDEENPGRKRNVSRRTFGIVVGPYWPMLVFVTYPIIFGVSLWAAFSLPGKNPLFILFWLCCTLGIIVALFQTSCRDPGIMLRRRESPNKLGDPADLWRWNDQALTWRPRGAFYDQDCACVVEKFDHTCPWTGTAIGKNNMAPFQCFVGLVFFDLMLDIYLIANS